MSGVAALPRCLGWRSLSDRIILIMWMMLSRFAGSRCPEYLDFPDGLNRTSWVIRMILNIWISLSGLSGLFWRVLGKMILAT